MVICYVVDQLCLSSPIALYYASTSSNNPTVALIQSTDGLVKGASCTLIFAVVARYAAHNGLTLYPLLFISYARGGFGQRKAKIRLTDLGRQKANAWYGGGGQQHVVGGGQQHVVVDNVCECADCMILFDLE